MNLIRVFSSDKKQLDIILQTVSVERDHPRGRTVLTFAERPKDGAPGEIRTPDPLVRSQMLYPAELRARAAILSKFKGDAVDGGRWVCARAESRETQRRTELRIGRGEGATKRRGMQRKNWWAWVDLNYRPHPYQGCALAT